MRLKTLLTILLILGLIGIAIGDRFLPQPLDRLSRDTRTKINQFLTGLFPKTDLERPSQQREDAIEEFQRKVEPATE